MANSLHRSVWNTNFGTAIIALGATLVGALIAGTVETLNNEDQLSSAERDRQLELSKFKSEIIKALITFDRATADMLLEHALRPVDPVGYNKFYGDYQDLLARLGATDDARADNLNTSVTTSDTVELATESAVALVAQFAGSDRRLASRRLVELYGSDPDNVVAALIGAIVSESAASSYRTNLYVAYTLSQISPAWVGTMEQFQAVSRLQEQKRNYADPTFRQRVDQAVLKYRPR
jgi:hypothetical protein